MKLHPMAGKPADSSDLIDVGKLVCSYYTDDPVKPVSFGTSGHRGSSFDGSFNEGHIAATAQAICDYRAMAKIRGPLFLGYDTHALSEPAFRTVLEVLAANGTTVVIHDNDEFTPTPVISFFILEHNRGGTDNLADGIVITPSHNPPRDGGIKYNPPHGGPADVSETSWIEQRANRLMGDGAGEIKRLTFKKALGAENVGKADLVTPFVDALDQVVDMAAIRNAGIRIGVDPMGGSGVNYWGPVAEKYGLNIEVVNPGVDPRFAFMPLDCDGKIRMDCSSVHSMAGLIEMSGKFDIGWGNDPDFDRHGIVCPTGLMNPNHYLSVAVWYLLQNRPEWKGGLKVGKTLVSSSMIDKAAEGLGGEIFEVPVGFKWFVEGLKEGTVAFGGEESAGAAFLRKDGTPWSTDKCGFSMSLLSAEILAKTGRTPDEIYRETLVGLYGEPYYRRVDGPVTEEKKAVLAGLGPDTVGFSTIAGKSVVSVMNTAKGNGASMGGIKVVLSDNSWFAMRPSGTEPKMKFYIESFGGEELWERIRKDALFQIFGEE